MAWGTAERARASLSSCSTESAREEVGDVLVGRWPVGIRMLARELQPVRAATRLAFSRGDGRVSGRGNTKARPYAKVCTGLEGVRATRSEGLAPPEESTRR